MDVDHKAKEIRRNEDQATAQRRLTGRVAGVCTAIAVAMSLFHLYTAGYLVLTAMVQRSVHLAFALTLIFILFPGSKRSRSSAVPVSDWFLVVLAVVSCLYIAFNWSALAEATRIANPSRIDLGLGTIALVLVMEATRRTAGLSLPLISVGFILYGFLGPYMPGALAHPGVPLDQLIGMNYLFTEGIFGSTLGVSATFVIVFIIFGAFLDESGGGKFFIDLASAGFGAVRGGPAKIAIVGSGFFGMISGSAVANVAGVGTFTIPLMKRVGYSPNFAAAVEAVASTGGMVMPPVMGAAAFIMAEMLSVPYMQICLAALLPAFLYYLSLYVFVDIEAVKTGLKGLAKEDKPVVSTVLRDGGHLLIPPVVLVYLLAITQWSAMKAGFWAVVATAVVAMARKATRLDLDRTINALRKGAVGTLQVAAVCACAGIMISIVSITGLGLTFSALMIDLSGGSLLLLLVLTMLASLILGAGLPATPCYIILAVLAAPAIVELGVPRLAAHLFVFYFGCLSAVSPPVAVASYAAAAIAGCNPMRAGWTSFRLSLPVFVVPFMFVYGPPLIMQGSALEIVREALTASIGVVLFAAAIQGFGLTVMGPVQRVFGASAALLLLSPGWKTDLFGLALAAAIAVTQMTRRRRQHGMGSGIVSRVGIAS